MEYLSLGRSGPIVSRIGLGCMSLPVADSLLCEKMVHAAIDAGINLIDTADLYDRGRNEEVVGMALQGCRDRVVLATKVGNRWRSDGSSWDWDPSPSHIRQAVEESLRRLKTDRIDLYQLHGGTLSDPIDEVIGVFEDLKSVGKILHYGISSIRPNVVRTWVERSSMTSVMAQYGLADRRPEEEILPLLSEAGIGVLARGVLAKGLLCGKPSIEYLAHGEDDMARAAKVVRECSVHGRGTMQTAIRFALHSEAVTTAVVGVSVPDQLEALVSTFSTPALTDLEYESLRQSILAMKYVEHR